MRRVAAGDADAFERVYDAHYRLVYGIALRVLGDCVSAEDLTQSVFLKLWTSPHAFKGGCLAAWIARVTRNGGLDILRRRAGRKESALSADLPVDGAFEDAVIATVSGAQARDAVARLPHGERTLIELGFFGGMTYPGIATALDLPLGTVKTRIRSGLRRLRSALEGPSVLVAPHLS